VAGKQHSAKASSSLCSGGNSVHLEYDAHEPVSHNGIVFLPERLKSRAAPYAGRESYPLTDPSTRRFVHWRLCSVEESFEATVSIRDGVSEGAHQI
jgi:hypothetical protein